MKRAEISLPNVPMEIRSYETIPEPPKGGVVVKTTFCGICHSDVHLADNEFDLGGDVKMRCNDVAGFKYPAILGHEISGVVHSMDTSGDDDRLKIGDRVIVYPWIGCSNCSFCEVGQGDMCRTPVAIGCGIDGGYSEYVPVGRKDVVLKIPDDLPLDIACMLPCSGLTGYNAVTKVKPTIEKIIKCTGKAALLIVGAGGLGLWCLQTARASLPKGTKIIAADINEGKLQNALEHGADDTVLWDRSLSKEKICGLTKAKGVGGEIHAIIDFVNSGTTTSHDMGCIAKGGAMVLVGLFGGSLTLPLPIVALTILQIFGVYVGSLDQLKELLELVVKAKLKPPEITHVTLEDISEVHEKLRKGDITGRALVKF